MVAKVKNLRHSVISKKSVMVSIQKFWIVLVLNRIEYRSNHSIRFEISNIRTALNFCYISKRRRTYHKKTLNTGMKNLDVLVSHDAADDRRADQTLRCCNRLLRRGRRLCRRIVMHKHRIGSTTVAVSSPPALTCGCHVEYRYVFLQQIICTLII